MPKRVPDPAKKRAGKRSDVPRVHVPVSLLLAWVLWLHGQVSVPERGVKGDGTWVPREGYETKAECEAALGEAAVGMQVRAQARGQKAEFLADGLVISEPSGGGLVMTYRLTCFPDGTDPRPRPAK